MDKMPSHETLVNISDGCALAGLAFIVLFVMAVIGIAT